VSPRLRGRGSTGGPALEPLTARSAGMERLSEERRCLVVDDQPVVRLGVRGLLAERYEVEEAGDGQSALRMLVDLGDFDVAIVEFGSAGDRDGHQLSGTAAIRALHKARTGLGIVAHGSRPELDAAAEAMDAGATAYVAKSSPTRALTRAVDAAAKAERFVDPAAGSGGRPNTPTLTRRQRQILQMIADGHSTRAAAKRLGLSTETVRAHTKAILARLGARDRVNAVAIALRSSLIE
jgi:two-component system, NarL family, response regulator